ncbi:MAG: aminotransferase class I/II-fold pyridoxal phosphate-dependent enzyme, partial [Pseudomonadota bacterium]|nr:aminotransferase class I/II-fold pyridoxal phosphate-dependent enzyme [Pseudomonadota bacterium]
MGPRSGDGIGDAAAFLPYGRQVLDDEDIAAVVEVLRGDWLTTGPTVDAYEERFRDLTGAAHAVACSSGTAGLHLAALASGIAPGDRVLVPAVTFLATANAVRFVGGEVVFADVDAETGLMTPATAAAALAAATGPVTAVMPVHLTGQTVDLSTMGAVLDGRRLIEDACHALGSRYPGMAGDDVAVGACPFGGITMFSSHPVKTIATGEGGMLTTNDGELAALLRRLRNHGMTRDAGA